MIKLLYIDGNEVKVVPCLTIERTDAELHPMPADLRRSTKEGDRSQSLKLVINEAQFTQVRQALASPWLFIGMDRAGVKLCARVLLKSYDLEFKAPQAGRLVISTSFDLLSPFMGLTNGWATAGAIRAGLVTSAADLQEFNTEAFNMVGRWLYLETGQAIPFPIALGDFWAFVKPGLDLAPFAKHPLDFLNNQEHGPGFEWNGQKFGVIIA